MPNYDVQVVLGHNAGLPEDNYVNTLHFEVSAPDTIEGLCDGINAAYQARQEIFANQIEGITVKVYTPGPNPTGPTFSKSYPFSPSGGPSPAEVAVCLSYAASPTPDESTPRRRGRIYLGPLANSQLVGERPSPQLRDQVSFLGAALAQIGFAANTTWVMYSQSDDVYATIDTTWVDDAWDTQRRRGLKPTMRLITDVQ